MLCEIVFRIIEHSFMSFYKQRAFYPNLSNIILFIKPDIVSHPNATSFYTHFASGISGRRS
jgi:hypothetical protein